MRKAKILDYTFLIICEGENTEPSFFKLIRNKIIEGVYKINSFDKNEINITIRPEPKDDLEQENVEIVISPHKAKRNNKKLKKQADEEKVKKAPFPLNFVKEGQTELEDGTFNEVWVVFDHDNHPARKEAFEESERIINGKKVQIAFSSIAFEYYLLLHFERLNKIFTNSECREGKENNRKLFMCGTGAHESDCYGELCIGGYARQKGYWVSSKKGESTFLLVQDKLEIGFINSAWLRYQSFIESDILAIYNRNPYVTSDFLVKRLTGFENHIYEWFSPDEYTDLENISIRVSNNKLYVKNISKGMIIIPENSLIKLQTENYKLKPLGERLVLDPNSEKFIEIAEAELVDSSCFIFTYHRYKKIFSL